MTANSAVPHVPEQPGEGEDVWLGDVSRVRPASIRRGDQQGVRGGRAGFERAIWKKHFSDYTPILDFVHVVRYLDKAANGPRD